MILSFITTTRFLSWIQLFLATSEAFITYNSITNVTQHEKNMLIYTKYTTSHYFNYLTFCVSYSRSVKCIGFSIVSCTISKSFIDKLCLDKKL